MSAATWSPGPDRRVLDADGRVLARCATALGTADAARFGWIYDGDADAWRLDPAAASLVPVLLAHGAHAYGQRSQVGRVAQTWTQQGFDADALAAWLAVGIVFPEDAAAFTAQGGTPDAFHAFRIQEDPALVTPVRWPVIDAYRRHLPTA